MKRNYGVDMAKFLSMFMVIMLHNLLQGGVLSFKTSSFNNMGYWFLENLSISAVNIFALISGFLMVDKNFNYHRIIRLWKIVLFWSVVPTVTIMYITHSWNNIEFLKAFFPVTLNRYWYFNAYIGVFLLSPFVNAGFKILTQKQIEIILSSLLILSCTIGVLGNFFLEGGYSTVWILIMYITGAYLKKTTRSFLKINSPFLGFLFILNSLFSLLGEITSINYIGHIYGWISYSSPFIVIQSISIFLIFQRINTQNKYFQRFLKKATPLTFSIYLIDTNPTFFKFWHLSLKFITSQPLIIGIITIVFVSIILFIVFLCLDYLRSLLFKVIRI